MYVSLSISSLRGHQDKIFVVRWNPHLADQLVTVGMKHIKFWTQTGGGITSKRGTFGDVGKLDTMLCVTYSQDGTTALSGAVNGMVYVWNGTKLASAIKAHTGPVFAIQTVDKVGEHLSYRVDIRSVFFLCRGISLVEKTALSACGTKSFTSR